MDPEPKRFKDDQPRSSTLHPSTNLGFAVPPDALSTVNVVSVVDFGKPLDAAKIGLDKMKASVAKAVGA